jgi:hypothetical protein
VRCIFTHHLHIFTLVPVLIELIIQSHPSFAHLSISITCIMSDESESSHAPINTRYTLRDRGIINDMLIAHSLQSDEFNDFESDSNENDDVERSMIVHDENNDNDDDDENEDNQVVDEIDMSIDESINTGKNEADESVLLTDTGKKHHHRTDTAANNNAWSTQISNIILPFNRTRHRYGNNRKLNLSSMKILQLYISKQVINRWVSYTNEYSLKYKLLNLDTDDDEMYAFIGVHVYMGICYLPDIHMYWNNEFTHPFIQSIFSRHRFSLMYYS